MVSELSDVSCDAGLHVLHIRRALYRRIEHSSELRDRAQAHACAHRSRGAVKGTMRRGRGGRAPQWSRALLIDCLCAIAATSVHSMWSSSAGGNISPGNVG